MVYGTYNYSYWGLTLYDYHTVDGRNPNHQLIGGKHPIILDGVQPSKVVHDFTTIHSMLKIDENIGVCIYIYIENKYMCLYT